MYQLKVLTVSSMQPCVMYVLLCEDSNVLRHSACYTVQDMSSCLLQLGFVNL